MKVSRKIIFCCSIGIILLGCNEDYVSGVTKGGSSSGRPTLPDHRDGRVDPETDRLQELEHYELTLNPSITDQCGSISRKITFLDRLDQDIKRTAVYIFNQNEIADHGLHVRLEYANHGKQAVSLKYSDCDVPLSLFKSDHSDRLFPKQECSVIKTVDVFPNQNTSFDLHYDLNTPIHGFWMPSATTKIQMHGISQSCDSLELPFHLIEHK